MQEKAGPGLLRRFIRFLRRMRQLLRIFDVITRYKVIPLRDEGILLTIPGSTYHDTILVNRESVSSHITRNIPGGDVEHPERVGIKRETYDRAIQSSVQREIELPDSKKVFVFDKMSLARFSVVVLTMTWENRKAMADAFERDRLQAAQDIIIGMASGKIFGRVILSKMKLKQARKRGHTACVLEYEDKIRLATIKERSLVIVNMMDRETLEIMGRIINYYDLVRHLATDEQHLLGVDADMVEGLRKQVPPRDR